MENCTYLCCKELSNIGKVGTEYEAWCDIKPKSIINDRYLFLKSLTKSTFFYFKKLIVVQKGSATVANCYSH